MFSTIHRLGGVLVLCAAFLLTSAPTADAAECRARSGSCVATVSTSLHTTQPTLFCYKDDQVIHIALAINCLGTISGPSGGSTTAHRCSSSDEAIVFNDGTNVHTLRPVAGGTWGDINNGHCGLVYTIS